MRGGAGVALAGLLAASCAGGGDSDAGSAPPAGRTVVCAPPAKGVPGYVLVRRQDVPFADHIGLRLEFRDPRGRRLYLLMGVPGGVGEGLPLRSTPAVAGDAAARFLGRDDRWVLAWEGPDPCEDMAVVGNDLSRPHFRRVLGSMGIWCDRSVSGGCHDGGA